MSNNREYHDIVIMWLFESKNVHLIISKISQTYNYEYFEYSKNIKIKDLFDQQLGKGISLCSKKKPKIFPRKLHYCCHREMLYTIPYSRVDSDVEVKARLSLFLFWRKPKFRSSLLEVNGKLWLAFVGDDRPSSQLFNVEPSLHLWINFVRHVYIFANTR